MSPAAAAQLTFAAEFATFLVAVAGLAAAVRPGVLSRTGWSRSALATGFLGLAVTSFVRGALVVEDAERPMLQLVRVAALVALAAGSLRWRGRRSRVVLLAGVVAVGAAAVLVRTGHVELGDTARAVGAALLAAALVLVARRAMAARISVDAALLVLGVVLAVALAVSVTVSDNVEGEALDRYSARATGEADAVAAEARDALGPARLVAGVLAAERAPLLVRVAEADVAAADDVADLDAALARLTDEQLLDLTDPVAIVAPDGAPVAASPAGLGAATRLALAGDPVVAEAQEAGAERQGVAVIGDDAYALAAAPVVVRPDGQPQVEVATVLVARRLDDTYLRVLGTQGEDLAFALVTPSRVVATSSRALPDREARRTGRQVVEEGRRPEQRTGGRFLAAAPVVGGDGRPVLAFVVSAPSTAAEATREALFRTLFVVALAAALVAVAIGVLVGERIGQGLSRLTTAAQRFQAGSLDTEVRVRSDDELGVLGGAFTTMAGSIREMTNDLRAAAEEEAALRSQLQTVISGMSEALIAVDADGVVIELNRAGEVLLGTERRHAAGLPAGEVVSWRLSDGTAVAFDRSDLIDGEPMTADLAVGSASIPVVVTSGRLRGADDRDEGTVVVLRDVRREREVEDLKASILANIGHELRTPLTPIKGYAGMLRDHSLDRDQTRSFAEEIIVGVDQLERVVGQLVTFATIAAGSLEVTPVEVSVDDVAEALAARWAPRLHDHHLEVVVVDGLHRVRIDRALFDQAVDELVDNAVKYSPDGGPVVVRFAATVAGAPGDDDPAGAEPGDAVTVTVIDQGVGIDPDQLHGIAEAFTQGDASTTRSFSGLGLGLACADRIVRAHGGRLAYASKEHRGTTVTIVLPHRAEPREDA